MIQLFEYGTYEKTQYPDELKSLLLSIWKNKQLVAGNDEPDETMDSQPFLKFDGNQIRAKNYIGFIQNHTELIEIYPKVFKNSSSISKKIMLKHIFFWFSYCRKWRFPVSQANLDREDIEQFPEMIIYLIATQFLETVSSNPFLQYQAIEETLSTPRGSINFSRYINRGMGTGNYHLLECDHEPFLFDNKVNRIIKYCTRLLLNQTRLSDNQKLLQDVIFVLDEVEDVPVTLHDIESINLNPFFEDYRLIMDMCKSILNQQVYSHNPYDFSQWCLLFPMEYVFEDFLAGFLHQHFSGQWNVEYQKSNAYLSTQPKAFQMQHDIFLTSRIDPKRQIIIDAKYKLRYPTEDKKKGISQSDMYQVVSYAYRRGCKEALLIYPNFSETLKEPDIYEIESGFDVSSVKVIACEVPFWSTNNFSGLTANLINELGKILNTPSTHP